jgi:hypothetical protein
MFKKSIVWIMVIIFLFSIGLLGCGVETVSVVVTKAVTAYLKSYIKNTSDENTKLLLTSNEELLVVKAVHNYFYEIELSDLNQTDKVKQSVLLAIAQIKEE